MADAMEAAMDEKARRVRNLLASYYTPEAAAQSGAGGPGAPGGGDGRRAAMPVVGIDGKGFDADRFVANLLRSSPLDGLLSKHVEMAAEIKNLDSDMQMLVYENYNKFISATDTIRRMKDNVAGMETKMDDLLETVTSVRSKSDSVNSNLSARREKIEQLNGTRSLLRKVQFAFDLPKRLRICLKHGAYAQAVKSYMGTLPILVNFGQTSFQSCREEADEVIEKVIRNLQVRAMSETASLESRSEAVGLLKQLNQPVEQLQEQFLSHHWGRLLAELQTAASASAGQIAAAIKKKESKRPPGPVGTDASDAAAASPRTDLADMNKDFLEDFARTASTFRAIFPAGEERLTAAAKDLFNDYFVRIQDAFGREGREPTAGDLLLAVRILSMDVVRLDKLVPAAGLPGRAQEAVEAALRQHVNAVFAQVEARIRASVALAAGGAPPLAAGDPGPAGETGQATPTTTPSLVERPLAAALDAFSEAVQQGCLEALRDLSVLVDEGVELLAVWKHEYVKLVQTELQALFSTTHSYFVALAASGFASPNGHAIAPAVSGAPSGVPAAGSKIVGSAATASGGTASAAIGPGDGASTEAEAAVAGGDRTLAAAGSMPAGPAPPPGLILLLAKAAVVVESKAVSRVTEALAPKLSGLPPGAPRPVFLPADLVRTFKALSDRLLQQYVDTQALRLSQMVRKSVVTPNWLKMKEPRDVRMVADLLLQEVTAVQADSEQLLDRGRADKIKSHSRSNSASGPIARSAQSLTATGAPRGTAAANQRSRSRLLERDVAKLFTERLELFSQVEMTQASILSSVIKICLKSLQENVRLKTFSRSGFQQIQLDTSYLRGPLREYVDDDSVVDTLLDEVCVAALERCLDPVPLEPSIIDKIISSRKGK